MSKIPDPKPAIKQPTIVGTGIFRTPAGWCAGFIRTDDPSIFVGPVTTPNLKAIAVSEMKKFCAQAWEAE